MKPIITLSIFVFVALLVGCKGRHDLAPSDLSYTPEQIQVGDEVTFFYMIENRGRETIPAKSYEVEFYVDNKLVSFDRGTSEIKPGGTKGYSKYGPYYHFKPESPGTYTYRLVLDPKETLPESDEKNNTLSGEILVEARPKHNSAEQDAGGKRE